MSNIDRALHHLDRKISAREHNSTINFDEFLTQLAARPTSVVRNIFQTFHDMVHSYVGIGKDEYPDDPESISYMNYDFAPLFVDNADHPFFADRLFANRFVNHVNAMKSSARQNKLLIFEGPPGSGKSTFLNNLLLKFEEYANSDAGTRYEVVWRLDRRILAKINETQLKTFMDRLSSVLEEYDMGTPELGEMKNSIMRPGDYIEVLCPSHDSPLLLIPKRERRSFYDDLFKNDEFKWKLYTEKEYEWVFRDTPCTICSSIYETLIRRLPTSLDLFRMVHARPYHFNRRLGEGITVFNPGDKPMKQSVLKNDLLQEKIDKLLGDSNSVRYIYSSLAKTNNGIYTLMDVKSHNTDRLLELHNIISEGIHKVEDVEENVNSLFIALMNPEDEKTIEGLHSFSDRIEYINIPYVMDLNTEVEIYRKIFGKHIDECFLPRVLHNFARVIISTRMSIRSEGVLEWIGDPEKYQLYCDDNLQILKMELFTGHIPSWLTEEDHKHLTAKRRRRIIAESENEGVTGFSGRDSVKIFSDFFTLNVRKDQLISMSHLRAFFARPDLETDFKIPEGFMESLLRNYNYTVVQEVKESLYNYNEEQISRDILNYLFAINFEPGSVQICSYTGDRLEINEEYLDSLEKRFLGGGADRGKRIAFRRDTQKEYTSATLTQEIMLDGKKPVETSLFRTLHERYVHNLKEKVLEPFLDNANFRSAIKDFDTEAFKTYDKRIRDEVTFLINNLCSGKFHYTKQSAREVCMYVVDNDLARRFPIN